MYLGGGSFRLSELNKCGHRPSTASYSNTATYKKGLSPRALRFLVSQSSAHHNCAPLSVLL
jgi:hypothetical protein